MIENAFENFDNTLGGLTHEQVRDSCNWGRFIPDGGARLRAIMNNIVENKGTFDVSDPAVDDGSTVQ